jgi:hypothetical protein
VESVDPPRMFAPLEMFIDTLPGDVGIQAIPSALNPSTTKDGEKVASCMGWEDMPAKTFSNGSTPYELVEIVAFMKDFAGSSIVSGLSKNYS